MKNETRTLIEDLSILRIKILGGLAKYAPLKVMRKFYKERQEEEIGELELFRGLFLRD